MIKIWKQKAPKQAKWFTKHPTQVLQQAKRVWKWSVESGKGKAWLYFVFAICQWLPTNYRMNYSLDGPRKICNLCLCNSMDTMDHLLQCPALAKEHLNLKQQVVAKTRSRRFRPAWKGLTSQMSLSTAFFPTLKKPPAASRLSTADFAIETSVPHGDYLYLRY